MGKFTYLIIKLNIMKKNYTLLACSLLMSIGLFGQTNLLLNPTFTSGDDWRGDAVGGCTGAELGAYDSSETNTADGSGCWQINACDNNNNRLQSATAFAVEMDNYTFTFYVKGTAGQVVTPWFFVTGSGNVLPVEGDYTIVATGVWEQVVRTHNIPAAANVTARIRLKTVDSSIKVDDVSLVLTSTLGVDDFSNAENITLYPNPVKDVLTVNSQSTFKRMEVYNMLGQKVMTKENTNTLIVDQLNLGIYILKAFNNNGEVATKQFIKQ
jgi:hypothetical protein